MNRFDYAIIHFLNAFAHRSLTFDALIVLIEESNFLKGGIALSLFWWAWFRYDKPPSTKREFLLFAFVSSSFALLLGRAFALWIPFRERPLRNPQYNFQIPYTVTGSVHSWNSAPSDHAVLFFCLATALWMVSWRLGILAACHAFFLVCLPRIYVGYHYPTDIVAGALLGIGAAFLCRFTWLRKITTQPALRWLEKHPASFYAFAFGWTFEVAELFESLLTFQGFFRRTLGAVLRLHL
ncbi:MAG: phosphatase PAP2 family protein [Bryobacteraceae bacterium]|jgi:undecaprenyl-diphosphatase